MIDCDHGLLPIAVDCLHYQENEQPSSEELCQRLAGLKETREYRESVEQVERVQNDIAKLERQMGEIQSKDAQLCQKELQIQQLKQDYSMKEKQSQSSLQHVHHQEPCPPTKQIKVGEWRDRGSAPYAMVRGAAVVDGNVAYFIHCNHPSQVCS